MSEKTDNDIFDMYANQADRKLLAQMSVERIAADLMEIDDTLDNVAAIEYARAIRRILSQTFKNIRDQVIHVRVSRTEREMLESQADQNGMQFSEYIRSILFRIV